MAKKLPPHLPLIDNKKTGAHLRRIVTSRGITIKEIQNYLGLSCPQGIYRWLDGKNLPNIDNLYALQGLLNLPIDRLLLGSYRPPENVSDRRRTILRSSAYRSIACAYAAAGQLISSPVRS